MVRNSPSQDSLRVSLRLVDRAGVSSLRVLLDQVRAARASMEPWNHDAFGHVLSWSRSMNYKIINFRSETSWNLSRSTDLLNLINLVCNIKKTGKAYPMQFFIVGNLLLRLELFSLDSTIGPRRAANGLLYLLWQDRHTLHNVVILTLDQPSC